MADSNLGAPQGYSNTNIVEFRSISTFRDIIDNTRVMPDIKELDTHPNIDGYLELIDKEQAPIGKLEIQIKTLADGDLKRPKYTCSRKFLAYCENATLPVLLVVVDNKNKVAYWASSEELLSGLKLEDTQKEKTFYFDGCKSIVQGNNDYLKEWILLSQKRKEKIDRYEEIVQRLNENEKKYNLLQESTEPTLGEERVEFVNIHRFLDFLNSELDNNFKIIKETFFPPCWKLGFAYSTYTDTKLGYALYPIQPTKNDVQIKKVEDKKWQDLLQKGLIIRRHLIENPILTNYRKSALEVIGNYLERLITSRILKLENLPLSKEFIFDFIDTFHIPLSLEIKDEYNLNELDTGLQYLGVWVEEALKEKITLGRLQYIDLSLVLAQLDDNQIEKIDKTTKQRLEIGTFSKKNLTIYNKELPLWLFVQHLDYLRDEGILSVKRMYIPKHYTKKTPAFIWSFSSPEEVKKNVETCFQALPEALDNILETNFPNLRSEFNFFADFDRLIVVLDVKDHSDVNSSSQWKDAPKMSCYYLKNLAQAENRIEVYLEGSPDSPLDSSIRFDEELTIGSDTYRLQKQSHSLLLFIYQKLPLMNQVYSLLDEKFRLYFNKRSRPPFC